LCESALVATLRRASELSPAVWFARLDEISNWWKSRTNSVVTITNEDNGYIHVKVSGPEGVTVLVRGVDVTVETEAWNDVFRLTHTLDFELSAKKRPFIGVSPDSPPNLRNFLQQQGYIIEISKSAEMHTIYLDTHHFSYEDERLLLLEIEQGNFPLVRLGRWPRGTHSALCITGDIDALTIWDYGLRFLGN
jgi:hypothetical protein